MKRSWPRFVVPVLLLASLPACGIQPTGVTDVGRAAGGVHVFYVLDGRLHPVARRIAAGETEKAVAFLFLGPDRADRAAGITTDIPPSTTAVYRRAGRVATIVLNTAPANLTPLAQQQISCTVRVASPQGESVPGGTVTLIGPAAGAILDVPACPLPLP